MLIGEFTCCPSRTESLLGGRPAPLDGPSPVDTSLLGHVARCLSELDESLVELQDIDVAAPEEPQLGAVVLTVDEGPECAR